MPEGRPVTSVASEPVVFSSRAPQFQRSQSTNPSQDGDTPFSQMLEASAPPPADPAPRRPEPSEPSPPPQKTAAAAPKKKTSADKPENTTADTSEPASDEALPEDKIVVEAAEGSEEAVIEEALPDVPQTGETAEDGTETADPEVAIVQDQAETAQPAPAAAPQIAAATALPATPEAITPAQAEGDAIPEIAATPVGNVPAAKPAPEAPGTAPLVETPDAPLPAQAQGGEDLPGIKGKPELKSADVQMDDGAQQSADAEAQPLLPAQPKVEHARPQLQHEDAKLQQTDGQPKEAQQPAEPANSSKPAQPQMTGFEPDLANPPVQQTQPTVATDIASLTAGQQRTAPLTAQTPVPVSGIAVEIAAQAKAGNNRFEIRLDPPELGRIDVRLDVDTDGNVKSRLVIERADTYDLLRKDASTLERTLQQAGLKTSDSGLEFTLRDQGSAQREARDQNQRNAERGIIPDADVLPAEAASGYNRMLGLGSGIDIRI
jgi:chemotaxis protein MotD